MLTKEQVKEKHKEVLQKIIPIEHNAFIDYDKNYICRYNLYSNKILRDGMTCDTCPDNDTCEFAFDAYNTDGDCIAVK